MGVYLSTNNGANWSQINVGLVFSYVWALDTDGTNIFAVLMVAGCIFQLIMVQLDCRKIGLTSKGILLLLITAQIFFAGTLGNGVFLSTNNGTSWTAINNGLTNTYVNLLLLAVRIFLQGLMEVSFIQPITVQAGRSLTTV